MGIALDLGSFSQDVQLPSRHIDEVRRRRQEDRQLVMAVSITLVMRRISPGISVAQHGSTSNQSGRKKTWTLRPGSVGRILIK
jgi:hypothetical protein